MSILVFSTTRWGHVCLFCCVSKHHVFLRPFVFGVLSCGYSRNGSLLYASNNDGNNSDLTPSTSLVTQGQLQLGSVRYERECSVLDSDQ